MDNPIINDEVKKDLRKSFESLENPVTISVFTKDGVNDQYNRIAIQLITEVAAVDDRINADFHSIGGKESQEHGVQRSPTILIAPDRYRIRFTGTPLGEEGRTLVMSIILASSSKVNVLSPESTKRLHELKEKRQARVFVSPT